MHLPVPTPHLSLPRLSLPHLPDLHLAGRLPVATVLLSVVYAAAIVVALLAPGEHVVAGCVVLAGLVSRSVVRRRRSAAGAVSAATVTVDAVLPEAAREEPVTAPAAA
ncbi:hypothetical protein [Modestobacter sp. VKM Ac-2985]|uniref:hypothetical protein n=1 Tax=Modestobacter sp. VKM Ac-2985 TaxID=3004139 RepID=UPI0022ABA913|nr:hypothetical protein [Modestobacter sp. VKM Ac-2985]MCZ2835854.1 hypothetical protein [Modestobacter sp. VKM Ac-2985]